MIKNNKISFLILFIIGLVGGVFAVGFHTPNEILSGNFTGEYNFINKPTINGNSIQLRIYDSCSAGSSIRQINADGSVECHVEDLGLVEETDTLQNVTSRGAFTSEVITVGGLNSIGNVGIGIEPTSKLHILGDVKWSGSLLEGTVPWVRLSNIPSASTSTAGIVFLSDSVSSTSSQMAATSKAVKAAYDLAASKGTGTVTSVGTGTGLTGTVTTTGSLNLDLTYTDGRYVNKAGDTITGNLWFTGGTRYIGTTDNNQFRIRTNNADRVTILNNGNVGIGTTNPSTKLMVVGGSVASLTKGTGFFQIGSDLTNENLNLVFDWQSIQSRKADGTSTNLLINPNGGNVGIGTTYPGQRLDIVGGYGRVQSGYSWLTNSDLRYKTDIVNIENTLNKIENIRGVYYKVIDDETNKTQIGVIAQELEVEFPQLVITDDTGYKSVAYDKLSAVLIEAIKEQQNQIEELKSLVCIDHSNHVLCK